MQRSHTAGLAITCLDRSLGSDSIRAFSNCCVQRPDTQPERGHKRMMQHEAQPLNKPPAVTVAMHNPVAAKQTHVAHLQVVRAQRPPLLPDFVAGLQSRCRIHPIILPIDVAHWHLPTRQPTPVTRLPYLHRGMGCIPVQACTCP